MTTIPVCSRCGHNIDEHLVASGTPLGDGWTEGFFPGFPSTGYLCPTDFFAAQLRKLEDWADRFPPPPPMPVCPTCNGNRKIYDQTRSVGDFLADCPNCDNGTVPIERLVAVFNCVVDYQSPDAPVNEQIQSFCRYLITEWRRP